MTSCRNRSTYRVRLITVFGAAIAGLAALTAWADSVPFWGAKESVPADTPAVSPTERAEELRNRVRACQRRRRW